MAFTVGHSTRTIEEFIALLSGHAVSLLVDVRTVPRSRTNPQFNKDVLPKSLKASGIDYVHVAELGGLRKPRKDSPNGGWRNLSFRGYADHMQSEQFADALDQLVDRIEEGKRIALMCAEAVPWRCHRSLIGDALTARGLKVEELVSPGKRTPHRMTPFAKVEGTIVTYPEYEEA